MELSQAPRAWECLLKTTKGKNTDRLTRLMILKVQELVLLRRDPPQQESVTLLILLMRFQERRN